MTSMVGARSVWCPSAVGTGGDLSERTGALEFDVSTSTFGAQVERQLTAARSAQLANG